MSPDRIELRGLRTTGFCGVLPEEQVRPQPLELDLDVVADLAAAAGSDDLTDTVDYGRICQVVDDTVAAGRPALLEALAEHVAAAVLAEPGVEEVTVTVRKLRPPVPQQLATSGVRITRRRAG